MAGMLYLVATPIGNLEDVTLRALRVMKEADLVAAEDTRHTRKLLRHFEIDTPLVSCHQHTRNAKLAALVVQMQQGKTVALVSDAGTPVVSDPGAELVRQCVAAGVPVVPVPGPSAVLTALAASGLEGQAFTFVGFLPKKTAARRRALAEWRDRAETIITFESPERLAAFLQTAAEVLGNREAVVARELTKKFEEFTRGSLGHLAEHWAQREARGEFTVVIAGATATSTSDPHALPAALARYHSLIADGCGSRAALRQAATETGVARNELYDALLLVR